jgi:hypothetical protein
LASSSGSQLAMFGNTDCHIRASRSDIRRLEVTSGLASIARRQVV